jgi:hypothetical protein
MYPNVRILSGVVWLWIAVLVVGGALVLWQAALLFDAAVFRYRSIAAEGRVVHLKPEKRNRDDGGMWHTDEVDVPIVEFPVDGGARRRVVMTNSDVARGTLTIDSRVTVRYDPRNPAHAQITGIRMSPISRHTLGTAMAATLLAVAVWVVRLAS